MGTVVGQPRPAVPINSTCPLFLGYCSTDVHKKHQQPNKKCLISRQFYALGGKCVVWSTPIPPPPPLLFLFLMRPFSASNRRWGALAAGSNYLDPNSWGVIRETGRTIWLHDWHCLMIMGSSATLLWSTNHTGLACTALNAKEPWLEYRAAAHSGSPSPHAPQEVRRTAVAVTLHHLQHCH